SRYRTHESPRRRKSQLGMAGICSRSGNDAGTRRPTKPPFERTSSRPVKCYSNTSCKCGRMLVNMASIDDKNFLRQLGEKVRAQREKRGLTQQQLGDQCKLHRTFIGSV